MAAGVGAGAAAPPGPPGGVGGAAVFHQQEHLDDACQSLGRPYQDRLEEAAVDLVQE